MSQVFFFDTNVILYADDRSVGEKQQLASELFAKHLRRREAMVSLQVLQEYFAAGTRKLGLPAEYAQRKVELISQAMVVRLDASDVVSAIELHRLNAVSFWDSLILQAARRGGAAALYSEDMQDGSVIGGVRIVDPFKNRGRLGKKQSVVQP